MDLNSCLYDTDILHHRLTPKEHKFSYRFYSFYLDLDEIDGITKKIPFVSRNKFNMFSFYDKDHLPLSGKNVKENVLEYLKAHNIQLEGGKIMLLTYLRVFGYAFNPVSFYFCFDANNAPVCVIPEIGNTFKELKPFMLDSRKLVENQFKDDQVKYYYISPFAKLDDTLEFRLGIPGDRLNIRINSKNKSGKVILTSMMGSKKPLTTGNLIKYAFLIPFETLQVIMLIHWHALRLYLKKVPFEMKESNPHLQKGVYNEWFNPKTKNAKQNA